MGKINYLRYCFIQCVWRESSDTLNETVPFKVNDGSLREKYVIYRMLTIDYVGYIYLASFISFESEIRYNSLQALETAT